MKTTNSVFLALALALAAISASAAPADPGDIAVLQKLKRMYPSTRFTSVARAPIAGLYEVVMGQNVAYVGADGRHFLFGHLFDMRTQKDLTAAKLVHSERATPAASRVRFDELPLRDAIKRVQGEGSRQLAVFSDPKCPYCTRLDEALAQLDNITIYTFLVAWISPDSRAAAQAAWAHAVPDRADDTAVLDRNLELANRVGLRATPMMIAIDGRVLDGARQAAEIDAWLSPGTRPVSLRTPTHKESQP